MSNWTRFPGRALALLVLLAPRALAHDMWIVPPDPPPAAGELVEVRLRVGHAGDEDPVRRDAGRIVRFVAAGPGGESAVPGLDGYDPAGYFRPGEPGLCIVAYESTAAFSELPGERFTSYLEDEGLRAILRLRGERGEEDAPGLELYSRSLKSLFTIGEEAAAGDRRIGLPLELVAETLPSSRAPMVLRLFLRGEPLEGARVDVRRLDQAEPAAARRTDAAGRVSFSLGPGSWIAATVYMEASDSGEADWRSIFGNLTFIVPDDAPRHGKGD